MRQPHLSAIIMPISAMLNRYPNPSATELQQTLRELMGIPNEFGVLLGNDQGEASC
jgi:histidinol-phosphate/aromatic aminotransferase/cobyric acid decarboxylase-like protein